MGLRKQIRNICSRRLSFAFGGTQDGGTGLGLSFVKMVMSAHGGRIVYRTRKEGEAVLS